MQTELDQARARITELENERAALQRELSAIEAAQGASKIDSPTLELIVELVNAYPAWRAQQKQDPLRKVIKRWLQTEVEKRREGGATRVVDAADMVIAEHYQLKA